MNNTFIFFNRGSGENETAEAVVFQNPVKIITCKNIADIDKSLNQLDEAISDGFFAAGFLSYELGRVFQEIPTDAKPDFPFICFGIFESLKKVPIEKLTSLLSSHTQDHEFRVENGTYSVPKNIYCENIGRIKTHLEEGNTYQVNYTFKYKFDFSGSPEAFFTELIRRQEVPYASFIQLDDWAILSLSPELFFRRSGRKITVKPMKGTFPRGKTAAEDDLNERILSTSAKNRAENIMIVDLLRNDLGRISVPGSVRSEELFSIEKYDTLFQMTSTISSRIRENLSWHDIFYNMFPSGSVTGAPKKRTMEIIEELENENRNIYTGSTGFITPAEQALFNVAIRTVLIDKTSGKGELGIGSGIVYDSDPEKEYDECILKGSFLTGSSSKTAPAKDEMSSREFDLIETMLWEKGEYYLLGLHLERLRKSAVFFSFGYDEERIVSALDYKAASFDGSKPYRVRLLLEKSGKIKLSSGKVSSRAKDPARAVVSDKCTRKDDIFLRHKTTNRSLYDSEFARYRKKDYFDVLFFNSDGELTEGAITNVVLRKGREYFTPPLSSGLLEGVYRRHLMDSGTLEIKEKVLRKEDLHTADEIFLINSVRKMVPVTLEK